MNVPLGMCALGRAFDGAGEPLDGRGALRGRAVDARLPRLDPNAPLTALNLNGGELQLNLNGAATTNIVATGVTTGSTTVITINSIVNIFSPVTISLISYTGGDPYGSLSLGALPTGYAGNLVDDTAHGLISLQFTTVDVDNPATNVIPGQAAATFNVRFNDTYNPKSLETELRQRLDLSGARYDLKISVSGTSFVTPPGPLAEMLSNAVQ